MPADPRDSTTFFFSSRRRHTRFDCDWSSDVCSSDLETVDSLADLLTSAMVVYLSTVSNRLNLRITRLTVFATLFLPLTFITGFFGMNFAWLVAHIAPAWTFWLLALGVMVGTTVLQLLYYRRSGWL